MGCLRGQVTPSRNVGIREAPNGPSIEHVQTRWTVLTVAAKSHWQGLAACRGDRQYTTKSTACQPAQGEYVGS